MKRKTAAVKRLPRKKINDQTVVDDALRVKEQEYRVKLEVINKEHECNVLMSLLWKAVCEKLGLDPSKTTNEELNDQYHQLKIKAAEYQKSLREEIFNKMTKG